METHLGILLREWRTARQLSLGGLAARSGLSKGTLSGWEAGAHQPRLPELEALFTALALCPLERQQVLALVRAPRAIRHLRSAAGAQALARDMDEASIPASGDLLRALRHRQRFTLEQVAATLSVRPSTVSRWEHNETWPAADQLNRLCRLLGAHEEEAVALTAGHFGWSVEAEPGTLEELAAQFEAWRSQHQTERKLALTDLALLGFEAHAWRLIGRRGTGWPLLAQVYAAQTDHLWFSERFVEARRYADRLLDLAGQQKQISAVIVRAVVRSADLAGARGHRAHPGRGIEILELWQPLARAAELQAWMLSEIAHYASKDGQTGRALTLAARACKLVEQVADKEEFAHRRLDQARVLLQCGRPHEALTALPEAEPRTNLEVELIRAQALRAMGNTEAAHEQFQHAYGLVNEYPMQDAIMHVRRSLAALAREF